MSLRALAIGAAVTFAGGGSAHLQEDEPAPRAPAPIIYSSDFIRQAVKDSLAAEPKPKRDKLDESVLSGDQFTKFSRAFSEAKVPDCLRPDALKHQPTSVEYKGWVFGVAGLPAVPFWAYAALTGKCRLTPD